MGMGTMGKSAFQEPDGSKATTMCPVPGGEGVGPPPPCGRTTVPEALLMTICPYILLSPQLDRGSLGAGAGLPDSVATTLKQHGPCLMARMQPVWVLPTSRLPGPHLRGG